jgi:photosystem II stability/assembly factor-like uncharacterized protein
VLDSCSVSSRQDQRANDYPNVRIQFIDSKTGFIIGPRLIRTLDGGKSWTVTEYQQIEDSLRAEGNLKSYTHDVQFVDREWGWRLSMVDKDSVEWTEDSGQTWSKPVSFGENISQRSLVFVNRDLGWVLGEQKVMKTDDRGRSWTAEDELMGLGLQFPTSLDRDHIWLAGTQGSIARSNDGGKHWSVSHDLPKNITAIFFISPMLGWVVGENGLIARTEDAGLHWRKQEVALPYDENRKQNLDLLDVFFIDQNTGWICGNNGLILRTTDGGSSWMTITSATNEPLVSIQFVDALHGWAVGGFPEPAIPTLRASNVVLETSDGGRTWGRRNFK